MYYLVFFLSQLGFFKKEPETEKLHDQHQTAHNQLRNLDYKVLKTKQKQESKVQTEMCVHKKVDYML